MVKIIIDLLGFLYSCAPLLVSLSILTLLCVLLSRSIKKHSTWYYIFLALPFVLGAIPSICRMFGIEAFSFTRVPILGQLIRDYIHMGTFGHPLLIIIMYIGALDPKIPSVKKLLNIRKELSIIVGFPVLMHSLIRVVNNFPNSLKFFTNHAGYVASERVTNELGAGISSFSFVLGIVMLALFLPLWITSFDSVHKRMGNKKWKKFQKWSYVLYATLFIHAMGIQVGGMLNQRGGDAPRPAPVEAAATGQGQGQGPQPERGERSTGNNVRGEQAGRSDTRQGQVAGAAAGGAQEQARPSTGGRVQAKGFADIKVSAQVKRYIHIVSLLLIYGSYLYLRIRKAKKDAKKKTRSVQTNA